MHLSDNARITLALVASMVVIAALCTYAGKVLLERALPPPLATVDVTATLKQQQERVARGMANAATHEERQRHLRQAELFGLSLDHALAQLRQECRCVLVLREAIVAGDVPDLTPRLAALIDTR